MIQWKFELEAWDWFELILYVDLFDYILCVSYPVKFPNNLRDISGISMQAELLVGSEADRQCKFLC